MFHWFWMGFWIVLSINLTSSFAIQESTNPEAKILWEEGQEAFSNVDYEEALYPLQLYVKKYPGETGYLKAHLYLGKSLSELDRPKEALEPLQFALSSSVDPKDRAQARIWLGETYLKLKQFKEASLISYELEQMYSKKLLSNDFLLEKWLIQSEVDLGFEHPDLAMNTIEKAELKIDKTTDPQIVAKIFLFKLKLKNLKCAKFPSSDALQLKQMTDQLDRRGTCLLENLSEFRKVLSTKDFAISRLATQAVQVAFQDYSKACGVSRVSKKTSSENQIRFQEELTDLLLHNCRSKITQTLDLLESWKGSFPPFTKKSIAGLSDSLKTLCLQPIDSFQDQPKIENKSDKKLEQSSRQPWPQGQGKKRSGWGFPLLDQRYKKT